jgi:hypothetical protein
MQSLLKYSSWQNKVISLAILLFCSSLTVALAQDMESVIKRVQWQEGPTTANLGDIAQVRIPSQTRMIHAY